MTAIHGVAPEVWEALGVSRESWPKLETFVDLLAQWQGHFNLVAPSTLADVWQRHVLDSLQLVPLMPEDFSSFADLGSGAGFPALPLAIVTGATAHLYESVGKKAAFLREALRITATTGTVSTTRIETLDDSTAPRVDVVTARALAPMTGLLSLAEPFLRNGARGFFHKGQDVDDELTAAAKSWRIKVRKHVSLTDSRAVILEVEEAFREHR